MLSWYCPWNGRHGEKCHGKKNLFSPSRPSQACMKKLSTGRTVILWICGKSLRKDIFIMLRKAWEGHYILMRWRHCPESDRAGNSDDAVDHAPGYTLWKHMNLAEKLRDCLYCIIPPSGWQATAPLPPQACAPEG